MKKLVLVFAVIAGGLFFAKKRRASRAEADLWHEATSGSEAS